MSGSDETREAVVEGQLHSVAAMLGEDGYLLEVVSADAEGIEIVIRAGPDACADCLVGPDLMEAYIRAELGAASSGADVPPIRLVMPAEAGSG